MRAEGEFLPGSDLDFRVSSANELAATVQAKLSAQVLNLTPNAGSLSAQGTCFKLTRSVLWSCSYGTPLRLKFPEGRDLRIQFHRKGSGATQAGRDLIAISEAQACIFAGPAEVYFGADYAQSAWRVPMVELERKLSALLGVVVQRALDFDPILDLATPEGRALRQLLDALLAIMSAGSEAPTRMIQAELENALLVALLCSGRHNFRSQLDRDRAGPAPWQVRRAESYIAANWEQPITLEDIVDASGVSARSLFRGFKEYRGYTPSQFLKHIRLQQAKALLQNGETGLSVTQVAMACGFSEITRFSKDFSRAFGAPPSRFLATRIAR